MVKLDDRRKHHRLPVDSIAVQGPIVKGCVVNLSLCGLAIETHAALTIGATYQIRLSSQIRSVVVHGAVRWCRLDRVNPKRNGDVVPIFQAGISTSKPPI